MGGWQRQPATGGPGRAGGVQPKRHPPPLQAEERSWRAAPNQKTGKEVRPRLGREEVKAEATPSLPLGLWFPRPLLQKSMRADSWRGAGPTGGGAAAVRGADSPLLAAPPAPAVGPAPAPALRETAILWSLRTRRAGQWRGISLVFFLPPGCVCEGGTESGPNERGLWGGMEPCVCQRPAPTGWTSMASLACPSLRPAHLSVYSYSSPGHNLR